MEFHAIRALPCYHDEVIPEEYLDEMGHMNVRWYMVIFSQAVRGLFASVGMDTSYFEDGVNGSFALQHYFRYLSEVRVGERVEVRTRVVGLGAKRLHLLHFLVDTDAMRLACTQEALITHVDLRVRRASPFPPAVAASLRVLHEQHESLPWKAPTSGVMHADR